MALKHNWRGATLYTGWYSPWWIMIISNIQRVVQLYNPITHQRIISHYDPMMFQRWPLWRFPEMRVPLNHPIFSIGIFHDFNPTSYWGSPMTLETSICQVYHYENPQAPHRGVFQHQVATDAMARGDQLGKLNLIGGVALKHRPMALYPKYLDSHDFLGFCWSISPNIIHLVFMISYHLWCPQMDDVPHMFQRLHDLSGY